MIKQTASLLLLFTSFAGAQTIELEPVRDNTLYESATGANSNGQGTGLFVGRNGGNLERRALLAFDLSQIPPEAVIASAELTFEVDMVPGGATPVTMALHQVSQDWGEGASVAPGGGGSGAPSQPGDATWIHTFFDGQLWQSAGGDFDAAPSTTTAVDAAGSYTFPSSPQILSDIGAWRTDPQSNFGWIILSDGGQGNARRLVSRENGQVAQRPRLIITLGQQPTPAAVGVPTLNTWGLFLMLSLVVLVTFVINRRNKLFGR